MQNIKIIKKNIDKKLACAILTMVIDRGQYSACGIRIDINLVKSQGGENALSKTIV